MGYVTSWGFIIDFVILDVGILIGWCLRVGLTRAQQDLPPTSSANTGIGIITRWE